MFLAAILPLCFLLDRVYDTPVRRHLTQLILRLGVRRRVSLKLRTGDDQSRSGRTVSHQARLALDGETRGRQSRNFRCRTGAGGPPGRPGGVTVEASFDDYNLDTRIRYDGAPFTIPERKPTPREIVQNDDGERLLAGYLIGRNADHIDCSYSDGTAEVHMLEPVAKLFGTPLITPSNRGNVFRIHPTVVKAIF